MTFPNITPSAVRTQSRSSLLAHCFLIALCLLATTATAHAQDTVELELVDPNGKKVSGAEIVATPEGGGNAITGTANKKGKYAAQLPPGNWQLVISAPGLGDTKVNLAIEEGMTQKAKITMVDEATAKQQEAIEAFNAGVAKIQANEGAEALVLFEKAAGITPDLAEAHRLIALITAQDGDIDRAEEALEKYLSLDPAGLQKVAPAAYEVYRARGEEARLPEVRAALREIGAASDLAGKVFNEGVAKSRENDKAGALALFAEASNLDPELAPAYRSTAALHFNDQEYEPALVALEQLLARDPDHRDGLRMAFFSHFELGQDSEASEYGGRWITAAPGASAEIVETANKTFEGNNPQDARRLLDIAVTHDPDNAVAHYTLGRVLAGQGETAKAKEHLARFLELSPNHPEADAARQMLEGL